jgi:hypothetical protein
MTDMETRRVMPVIACLNLMCSMTVVWLAYKVINQSAPSTVRLIGTIAFFILPCMALSVAALVFFHFFRQKLRTKTASHRVENLYGLFLCALIIQLNLSIFEALLIYYFDFSHGKPLNILAGTLFSYLSQTGGYLALMVSLAYIVIIRRSLFGF